MNKIVASLVALACFQHGAAFAAATKGTAAEAEEMVRKGVALMKKAGVEQTVKQINDPADQVFKDRDLFAFVYDFQGNMLAMAVNPRMVGKNMIDLKDADGVPLARGVIDMVKTRKKGWYGPFKFVNPQTQAYEYKKSYCEQGVGETLVCVGIYLGAKIGE